ncbi:MAG: hypothetical protein P8M30_19090 [Planctomycetaceae bacterium]|jgi:hypothetical protein|nr:hypothetical protein [Planctomycetaceae bacterium]
MADQTEDEMKSHWFGKAVAIVTMLVVLYLMSPPLVLSLTSSDQVILTTYRPIFTACDHSEKIDHFYSRYVGLFPSRCLFLWTMSRVDFIHIPEVFIGYPPSSLSTDP